MFVERVEKKVTTNPKLGQDRESRSIKKRLNFLLIVFFVTLYSLQKNTMFVDRVEQKVTTNPKLGQNHKIGQLKKQIYNYVLIVFIVTLWTGGGCMKW